ncbi:MAG: apolipoprotein N-acyltransferase, partial [bacterium]|nr:apolipoprotein N-acyltransferase [bacterium]
IARYDKMFLVPFGEFIPPGFTWINRITNEGGDFAPGEQVIVPAAAGHRLGSFICYESVFPDLVRRFADAGAEVFINLSNDGYFGGSAAREQHLLIARMRAAENRRWILRSTNDGITASIDPAGRVVRTTEEFTRTAVRLPFSYISETTLYTRFGDWFPWFCLIAALAAALALKR